MLEGVAAELLADVVGSLSRRMVAGAVRVRKRDALRDAALARELDTYAVLDELDFGPLQRSARLSAPEVAAVTEFLRGLEAHAIIHELLAARLLRAPEERIASLDALFATRLVAAVPAGSDHAALLKVAHGVFDALSNRCSDLADEAERVGSDSVDRLRTNAAYTLILATLDAIERHTRAFEINDGAEDSKFENVYRGQVRQQHGAITPPDLDRRKSVPLSELYVSPEIFPGTSTSSEESLDLNELWSQVDRAVLLGQPGGGKSTATGALVHRLAGEARGHIPFLVVLRDYAEHRDALSIVEFIERRLRSFYQCPAPTGFVERQLLAGRAAVFFDGLDELLDTTARRAVTDVVQNFSSRYPLARVFVTSRVVGYEQAPMDPAAFRTYRLSDFTDERVAEYAHKWFRVDPLVTDAEADRLADAFINESNSVSDLRRNPLMLALMCIIYRGENFIPKNRPSVYERCATLLFEKWDSHRHIRAGIAAEDYLDEALKHIAYWLLRNNFTGSGVTRSALIDETAEYLRRAFEDPVRARKAASEFVDFCKGRAWVFSDAGTTAEGEDLFKFTHQTFMEYFAAFELTRTHSTPEALTRTLLPRIARSEWDMVGQLAVAIIDKGVKFGADRVLRLMLDDRRRRTNAKRDAILSFVARCAVFAAPTPEVVRRLAREVFTSALRDGMPATWNSDPSMAVLLTSTQPDQVAYVEDELALVCEYVLSVEDSWVVDRMFATLITLEMWRTLGRSGATSSSMLQIVAARDALLKKHADRLEESCARTPSLRRIAMFYNIVSVEDFMARIRRQVESGEARLLDEIVSSNEPPLSYVRFPSLAHTLILRARRGGSSGGWQERLLAELRREFESTAPPYISAAVCHRTETHLYLPDVLASSDAAGDYRDKAALILWCAVLELTVRRYPGVDIGVSKSRREAPFVDDPLARARCGDDVAREDLPMELPAVVRQWALGEVDFVASA